MSIGKNSWQIAAGSRQLAGWLIKKLVKEVSYSQITVY
jgi:hypothetical protein